MIQRDDDEGVADLSVGDELRNFRDGHEARDQIFAAVEFHAVLQAAVFNQHGEGRIAQDGRIRMDLSEQTRVFAFVAGLLAQFTHSGRHRVGFVRIHHAAGNLQFNGAGPVAILLDHHELLVGRDGDDVDPVDAVEDEEVVLFAGARVDGGVRAQLEDAEVADEFGAGFLPWFDHAEILTQRRRDAEKKNRCRVEPVARFGHRPNATTYFAPPSPASSA